MRLSLLLVYKVKTKPIVAFLLTTLLVFFLLINSVLTLAQETIAEDNEKAMIVLDGKLLFKVGSIGNFTAAERAELINSNLIEEINSLQPLRLEIFLENEQTVIRNLPNNKHILNVTQSDVISGTTIEDQAKVWRDILQTNLLQGRKERTSSYTFNHVFKTFIFVVLALIFNVFFYFFGKYCLKKLDFLFKKPSSPVYNLEIPLQIIWNLTIFFLQIGVWIIVLLYISSVFPLIRSWRYQIYQTLDTNIFSLGESKYSAIDLLLLFIFTVGLWFFIRLFTILFKEKILSKTGANQGLQDVITIIFQYVLSFLGIIILWQIWGFDVSSLAILVSVLGVGIGFGLQNIANNFISGLIITIERPIQIGDFIKVGNLLGKVQKIGSRSTIIKTMDKVSIIIPNSRFLENDVINWNYEDPISRLGIPVGVAYGSNLKKVRLALLEAVKSHPDVLLTPRPQVWFQEFGDSSLNFEVFVWISEPAKQFQLKSELNYRIAASLYRYNIEIPFPQTDLHLRSPQLEQMIEVWLSKQGVSPQRQTKCSQEDMEVSPEDTDSFFSDLDDQLTEAEIEHLVTQIRGDNGVEIKDRRYRLNTYHTCFIGKELVDWLVTNRGYNREEATELGQILIEKKIIHHVVDAHPFRDEYLFYRFIADEKI
jgi:small-conductance mechanosensitive channel